MESIIITSNSNKKNILRKLTKDKLLYNLKFFSFNDLKKRLFFDYDNKTLEYIVSKYKVNINVAKTYLDNMYFLKELDDNKIKFLSNLKQELKDNNLLIINDNFRKYLKEKKIIIYGDGDLLKEEKAILDEVPHYEVYKKEVKDKDIKVYEASSEKTEVEFVCNKISELIENGIDINKIKIIISEEYFNVVRRYFSLFNIPINLKSKATFYSTMIAQEFLNNYDKLDIGDNVLALREKYDNVNDLVNIINKSVLVEDKNIRKEFIINDLKNTFISGDAYDKAVQMARIEDSFLDDEYVFLLGFNINDYPKVVKDEDYLSDSIKEKLGRDTSSDINRYNKIKLINKLKEINNLTITYKLGSKRGVCYPSLLVLEMKMDVLTIEDSDMISYSKINTSLKYAQALDTLYKFNVKDKKIGLYRNSLNIKYREYNNQFTGINKDFLEKALNNELVLAYTNMEMYNECAFKYYLSKILKIDIYEESFKTIIGTIVHHILEIAITRDVNIKHEIMQFVKDNLYVMGARELFYLDKLSDELEKVIKIIREQAKHSKLDKNLFEEELYVYEDRDNYKITFKGLIDKVMYTLENDKEILAVVDYKTGQKKVSLDRLEYGLDLQLPIYLYLLKKSERFKEAIIGGFYIQQVLMKVPNKGQKTIDTLRCENLKLQGFSNSDENILEKIDDEYQEGKILKNVKYKKDGTLNAKSKVLSNKEMDSLTEVVGEKIEECVTNIINGEFNINPKVINGNNDACTYCKFKDICFMKKEDEVILGGDDSESDSITTTSD